MKQRGIDRLRVLKGRIWYQRGVGPGGSADSHVRKTAHFEKFSKCDEPTADMAVRRSKVFGQQSSELQQKFFPLNHFQFARMPLLPGDRFQSLLRALMEN